MGTDYSDVAAALLARLRAPAQASSENNTADRADIAHSPRAGITLQNLQGCVIYIGSAQPEQRPPNA